MGPAPAGYPPIRATTLPPRTQLRGAASAVGNRTQSRPWVDKRKQWPNVVASNASSTGNSAFLAPRGVGGSGPDTECWETGKLPKVPRSGHFRICTYNIFEGLAWQNEARVRLFEQWVRRQDFDFIGLNEVNGFTKESLTELAARCGFPYCFLQKADTGYHLAAFSRYPFTVADTSREPLHHGVLHAKLTRPW